MRSKKYLVSTFSFLVLLCGCSDGSDSKPAEPLPIYDFSEVDARLQNFIDDNEAFDGISVTLVDRDQGTVHEAAVGDHPPNIITLLASVSKFASVTLLLAISEDESVDFDIDDPISTYLPWEGIYGDRTTAELLSNTSGIPGVIARSRYDEHLCQYDPDFNFEECAKLVYSIEIPGSNPAGTVFDYGGSQWYLAGAVANHVTNSNWNQAFDRYVAEPCELEVFEYGNMTVQEKYEFTGHPDSLEGVDNPHPGGGAISDMRDLASLLLLHLREGQCGNNTVISREAVQSMQADMTEGLTSFFLPGISYGMGWMQDKEWMSDVFFDFGAYGAGVWIDTERMIGGYVAIDNDSTENASDSWGFIFSEVIPLVGQIVDEARLELEQ